jgi:MFS family permease
MAIITNGWLIYSLTHSAWLMGLAGFIGQIPTFLLGPVMGVIADRFDRRKLLIGTQTVAMLQAFVLAFLIITHRITYTDVLILSALLGISNALDMPTRQSLMVRLVDRKEDLSGAIALNSSMVNFGRLIGPAIGGYVIAQVGEGMCYFINGLSFLAVIASICMWNLPPEQNRAADKKSTPLDQMIEGWKYVSRFPPIASILTLLALVSLLGVPYMVLMPIVAKEILHGDAKLLGHLMGCVGFGALVGALRLASRPSVRGLLKFIPLSTIIFGGGLIAVSLSRTTWLSEILLMVVGYGFISQLASSNTLVQTLVDDDKRGRVMSIYAMSFSGAVPFGNLLAGWLAHHIGVMHTFAVSGAWCVLGGLWFFSRLKALRKDVEPLYQTLGILPRRLAPELTSVHAGPLSRLDKEDDDNAPVAPRTVL